MELKTIATGTEVNGQHGMPDGHCCSLWIRHLSTWFYKQWIFTSVSGPHPTPPLLLFCFVFDFPFPISLCWYNKGVEETHSKQHRRYSFILLGRRSPCQRSMAILARITVISNLQFLSSKQFVAGRSRLYAFWTLSEFRYEGGGQGREERGEKMFLRLLLSLKGLPMALMEMRFSGQSSVTSVWGGTCHLAWAKRPHKCWSCTAPPPWAEVTFRWLQGEPAQGRSASTARCHITSAQLPDLAPHPSSPHPQG